MQRSGSAHVYHCDNYKKKLVILNRKKRKSMMINLDILRVADTAQKDTDLHLTFKLNNSL